ncbi:MAG: tripartite tricarboxylate transporter substrate binding protein, partial [Alicyclobacillus sp.]|nr:tripartite tricarboxylate transporter substrate binding protein [Alicyclobacillus sp.]
NVTLPSVITIVVPVAPGGGLDTTARALAQYLPKYLPGHPSVVVKNEPGGAHVIGINHVLTAKPDGSTLGIFTMPGDALNPLIGQGNYDLTKVAWIAQLVDNPYVAAVSVKSKFQSLQDLQKASNVRVGSTGLSTSAGVSVFIAAKQLGIHATYVPSPGSSQSVLAAAQGSVDFVQFPYEAERQEIEAGLIKPLWVYTAQRIPELPNVPSVTEMGHPELADTINEVLSLGTTPGTPDNIVQALADGVAQAMKDPELLKKLQAAKINAEYLDPQKTLAEVKNDIQTMQKYAPDIKQSLAANNNK